MPQSLYALALLACPVGMGLMMWLMMRGNRPQAAVRDDIVAKQAEFAGLQAQIDKLQARRDQEQAEAARQPQP